MRRNNMALTLVFMLSMIAYFVYNQNPGLQITTEYLSLLPVTIFLVITLYAVKNSHGVSFVGAWFFVGVALAFLADNLNTAGVMVPDWLISSGSTLQYLQVILIVVSTGIGVLMGRD